MRGAEPSSPAPVVHGFPPQAGRDARVLVLGSMPGAASLQAGQYYAHPRNAFWRLIGEITGTPAQSPYDERLRALRRAGIALWDVLQRCERRGSLDAGVDSASAVANDFGAFFASHRRITHVFFNGALAHTMFMRHVRPALAAGSMAFVRLPSTSPAHAALTLDQKRQQWASIARALGGGAD